MKFRPISFFEKNINSTKPIWGINTAAESDIGIMGEIMVQIRGTNGGPSDKLLVPQTWLPQELTRVVGRKRLLESTEFRKAVDQGLISLITVEDAQRLLRQDGATEEQDKIRERAKQIRKAGQARTLADSKTEVSRADGVVEDDDEDTSGRNKTVIIDHNENANVAALAANGVEDAEPGVTVQFKMWADRLALLKDMQIKNEIKSRRAFKKSELSYLQRSLPRNMTNSLTMINSSLSKMK